MLELLDLLDAPRAVIGGMSLGGFLSLLFCARHPERVAALLLVDTGPGFRDDAAREAWNALGGRARGRPRRAWPRCAAGRPGVRCRASTRAAPRALAAAARAILTQRDGEVFESLGAIAVPTLIVVGAEDDRFLAAADAMARRIPGAPQGPHRERRARREHGQPAEFNRAVLEFLEDL